MSATFLFPLPCPTAHNITKGNQCYLHKYIGAHTRYHKTPVTLPTQSQLWPSKATTIFTPTFSPRGREGNFFKVYTSRVKPSCPVLYLSHLEKKKSAILSQVLYAMFSSFWMQRISNWSTAIISPNWGVSESRKATFLPHSLETSVIRN